MPGFNLAQSSAPFLDYVQGWFDELRPVSLDELIGGQPERVGIFCVDVVVGFCQEGALASPRINAVVPAIADLFSAAHARGVRNFVLPQDTHHDEAVEFGHYARHCVAGTREAETVPELASLPFAADYTVIPKNSLSATIGTSFGDWMRAHPEVDRFIVVGDCTDLCAYNLAMHLRLYANAHQQQRRVIVAENLVQTYDLPIETALQLGAFPHPGDFYHYVFLHHMAQHGVEVVREIN